MTQPAETAVPSVAPQARRRWPGRVCGTLFALGGVVTLLAIGLPFRGGDAWGVYDGLFTVVFFARVYAGLVAVCWLVLGGLCMVARRWRLATACLALTAGWLAPELWTAWPRTPAAATGPTFSVASLNLNKDLADASKAVAVALGMNADVVVLQELSPRAAGQFEAGLAGAYPYSLVYPDTGYNGMAIFAKTPLDLRHAPEGSQDRNLSAVLRLAGRELELVDVHLAPPQTTASRRRNRFQVGRIVQTAGPLPVLMAGDYNFTATTPQAAALRRAGFVDARLQAGRGRLLTWPTRSSRLRTPSVRIDTAYAHGPLRATAVEVGEDFGSDHYPTKTTWCWTGP